MIYPLRRRHWRWLLLMTAFLPALFLLAIGSRVSTPPISSLPAVLSPMSLAGSEHGDWIALQGAVTGRVRTVGNHRQLGVELELFSEVGYPDVLVYWSGTPEEGSGLPDDAVLVGRVDDGRRLVLPLPAATQGTNGILILFSLIDGRTIGWTSMISP